VPALVVQGLSDPFGGPQEVQAAVDTAPDRAVRDAVTVVPVAGDHGLAAGAAAAADAVAGWLGRLPSSGR
jgi:predicted alpha/beta-hydrolase family hydrolase